MSWAETCQRSNSVYIYWATTTRNREDGKGPWWAALIELNGHYLCVWCLAWGQEYIIDWMIIIKSSEHIHDPHMSMNSWELNSNLNMEFKEFSWASSGLCAFRWLTTVLLPSQLLLRVEVYSLSFSFISFKQQYLWPELWYFHISLTSWVNVFKSDTFTMTQGGQKLL